MRRILLAVVLAVLLAAPARGAIIRAESILPPGESGFVSVTGLLQGTGSPHLYDQQSPFIAFSRKNAMLGQPGRRTAAANAFAVLSQQFGSGDPARWRAPRSMFKQVIQGAEQPPPMPFFDRGTWEQLVELGG